MTTRLADASGYDRTIETSAPHPPHAEITFDRPPLVEVALALQFDAPPVDTFDVATFGTEIRKDFPTRQEQPARPPMSETFDEPQIDVPFKVEFVDRPANRFWLLSPDESQLIQLQHNFFALNWRKINESSSYPRYSRLRKALRAHLQALEAVLESAGKSGLEPNWCEVTYVNHVAAIGARGRRLPLHDVLATIKPPPKGSFLPQAEDMQISQRFRIEEDAGPVGRLTVNAAPAYRTSDSAPIWVITLTARIRTIQPTLKQAYSRLDLGHEWVIRGFKELTTSRMHTEWGLQEGSNSDHEAR